jgi:lipopolysaccharide/colanic/teichoic acid biosynthesis glycosyltransferase
MKDGKLDEDAVFQVMKEGFKSAGVVMEEENIRKTISDCVTNSKHLIFFFIVVPCILIILKFFSPTNANFIKHMKC